MLIQLQRMNSLGEKNLDGLVNAGDQPVREREIEMEKDKTENSVASHCSSAGKCGTCAHFYRDTFHATVGGGEQQGGQCFLLAEILGITNSNMWATKSIHVQDTFGCVLHCDKVR